MTKLTNTDYQKAFRKRHKALQIPKETKLALDLIASDSGMTVNHYLQLVVHAASEKAKTETLESLLPLFKNPDCRAMAEALQGLETLEEIVAVVKRFGDDPECSDFFIRLFAQAAHKAATA